MVKGLVKVSSSDSSLLSSSFGELFERVFSCFLLLFFLFCCCLVRLSQRSVKSYSFTMSSLSAGNNNNNNNNNNNKN